MALLRSSHRRPQRRVLAAPFVVTAALAGSGCVAQSAPQPAPHVEGASTSDPATTAGSNNAADDKAVASDGASNPQVIANPPPLAAAPTGPGHWAGEYPARFTYDDGGSAWQVDDGTCRYSAKPANCPTGAICNPPPPQRVACPDGAPAKPSK